MKFMKTASGPRIRAKKKVLIQVKSRRKRAGQYHSREAIGQSLDSCNTLSEEVVVFETQENQSYAMKVTLGLLSRASTRELYWTNKFTAYFVILSYLITYDTVGVFFYYMQRFGVFFMFNYFVCMLVVGFPMCCLEMALGQYTSTGIYLVFDRMTPAFVGIAISAITVNFVSICTNHNALVNIAALTLKTWVTSYMELPWNNCIKTGDTKACYAWPLNCKYPHDDVSLPHYPKELPFSSSLQTDHLLLGDTCVRPGTYSIYSSVSEKNTEDYFVAFMSTPLLNYIYREVKDFKDWRKVGYPTSTHIFIHALTTLLLIYVLTRTKKTITTLLKIIFVITAFVLVMLLNSLATFFKPKHPDANAFSFEASSSILDWAAWGCAMNLTLRSLKLGEGAWTFFGSLFGFNNNLFRDCLILTIIMIFLPFFYAMFHILVIDSNVLEKADGIRHNAEGIFLRRNSLYYSEPFLVVTTLIDALSVFGSYQMVVTFCYSLVITLTTFSNKILRIEIVISAIIEMSNLLTQGSSYAMLVSVVVMTTMVCQLFANSEYAYFRTTSIEHAVLPIARMFILLFELFTVGIFYGFRVFFSNTSLMMVDIEKLQSKEVNLFISRLMLILWSVFIPIAVLFALNAVIILFPKLNPKLFDVCNITIICLILLPIPAFLLHRVYQQHEAGYSIKLLFRRNSDLWGPRLRSNRIKAEKAERMIRKWW